VGSAFKCLALLVKKTVWSYALKMFLDDQQYAVFMSEILTRLLLYLLFLVEASALAVADSEDSHERSPGLGLL
jgi:hypothetical protein